MIKENFYDDVRFNIVGIDEVGRGALCGPVVSCAVQLKKTIMKQSFITEIDAVRLKIHANIILVNFPEIFIKPYELHFYVIVIYLIP